MAAAAKPVRPVPGAAEARPARRRALGRDPIVETALGIVDAEGLDALSMRRVAQELNTGAASLYAHVSSKEELVELLLDRAYRDMEHPAADPGHWRQQVKDFLRQARDRLAAHNDLARAALAANTPALPNQLGSAEHLLALLRAGGLPDRAAAHGVDLLALYTVASMTRDVGDESFEFGLDVILAGLAAGPAGPAPG